MSVRRMGAWERAAMASDNLAYAMSPMMAVPDESSWTPFSASVLRISAAVAVGSADNYNARRCWMAYAGASHPGSSTQSLATYRICKWRSRASDNAFTERFETSS